MSVFDLDVGTCGCCEPPAPATPLPVYNRPSLDEIVYRVGTYASFRQAMIELVPSMSAELASELGLSGPPLDGWTSRRSDDYGIAVIEMWATIADILTFHSERYAGEGWLRTAEYRNSIRRLAGLLGYRPKPGMAAATYLAYTLDEGVRLMLPTGLRVQSVPAEDEQPQKFETGEQLDADAALNDVPVFGQPQSVTALAAGRTEETLVPGSFVPLAGDPVIFFTQDESGTEERMVEAVEVVDDRHVVVWSQPLSATRGEAHLRGRAFRQFGHSAPPSHMIATPQGVAEAQSLKWEQAATDFDVNSSAGIDLEGVVDGIEVGAQVLIVASGVTRRRTVQSVEHVTGSVKANKSTRGGGSDQVAVMTGDATRLTVDGGAFTMDIRTTRLYELPETLHFLGWELPRTEIPAGTKKIYVPHPEVQGLPEGRLLFLADRHDDPLLVVAEHAAPFAFPGSTSEFLQVELAEGLPRGLDASSARASGNVAAVTHGETVREEAVGSGDASQGLQEFTLTKAPVTHTADPTAPSGALSSVQVTVDQVVWSLRSGLYGAGPADRIYTTWIDDDQKMHLRFGDGHHGARLPTGRNNVVATYRQGLGTAGNLERGRLATALDKPTGVSGVVNPMPASGGVDPETTAGARRNAPNTVRTFDRAVSLADFAHLAREYSGVGKAFATWVWDGQQRVVHVTLGGEDPAPLSDDQLRAIRTWLDQRRDPNRTLRIERYRSVPFRVRVEVEAAPDRFNEDVHRAVANRLLDYFDYERRDFGQAVHLSDVYSVVQEADGVVWARVVRLRYKSVWDRVVHGAGSARVLVHAPIFGARHISAETYPAELASIDDSADVTVDVTGGLER